MVSSFQKSDSKFQFFFWTVLGLATLFFIHALWIGGITLDEGSGYDMLGVHYDIGFHKTPLSSLKKNLAYYGILNVLPGHLLTQVLHRFLYRWMNFLGSFHIGLHVTSFMGGLLTAWILVKLCHLVKVDKRIAWVTGAMLMIYPLWLGHSFFNFKDLLTAFFYTLFTYRTCLMLLDGCDSRDVASRCHSRAGGNLDPCLRRDDKKECRDDKKGGEKEGNIHCHSVYTFKKSLFFILSAIGLLGIKMAFMIPIFANIFVLFLKDRRKIKTLVLLGILIILGSYAVTPAAWHEPFTYCKDAILLMGKHDWKGCTLTWGECLDVHGPHWNAFSYLSKWFVSQLPLGLMVLLGVGCVAFVKRKLIKNVLFVPLLLQLLLLPVLGIVKNSVFYNGTRHLLFMVPILMLIAGMGIDHLYELCVSQKLKKALWSTLSLYGLFIGGDLWVMSPYQYIYYNEVARFFLNEENMLNDYWGFSGTEAFQKIPKPLKARFISGKFCAPHHYLDKASLKLLDSKSKFFKDLKEPFYYQTYVRLVPETFPAVLEEHCRETWYVTRRLLFAPHDLKLFRTSLCYPRP